MFRLKIFIVVLMLALTACMYTPDSTPTPRVEMNQEEDGILIVEGTPENPGNRSPIIQTAYFEKIGEDYYMEVIGSGFTPTVAVYGHQGVFGSGMSAVLSNVFVDENHLQVRLPTDRMSEECEVSCRIEIQVIYGIEGSVSNITTFTFDPVALKPTPTPTFTETPIPTATSVPTATPIPPDRSDYAPLLCTPLEGAQIWAWLPAGKGFYILGRASERYRSNFVLVQSVDQPEYIGWMPRNAFGISDEELAEYPEAEENNRCYPLTPEQQIEQDPNHIWVVTNPDLGNVSLYCAPDESSSVRMNLNESFVLVEKSYGNWLYGSTSTDQGKVYGWIKLDTIIPRTTPLGLDEITSQPPTHC